MGKVCLGLPLKTYLSFPLAYLSLLAVFPRKRKRKRLTPFYAQILFEKDYIFWRKAK
jgi:hypothetical protein